MNTFQLCHIPLEIQMWWIGFPKVFASMGFGILLCSFTMKMGICQHQGETILASVQLIFKETTRWSSNVPVSSCTPWIWTCQSVHPPIGADAPTHSGDWRTSEKTDIASQILHTYLEGENRSDAQFQNTASSFSERSAVSVCFSYRCASCKYQSCRGIAGPHSKYQK